jgi:DNA-binding MarR family transcriptional regulator
MTIPRSMNPVDPEFSIFDSLFYLIAHADFRYHEDLDKVMAKVDVDRTTYRLMTVLLHLGRAGIKVLCKHALLKPSTGSRAIERMREKGWVSTQTNAIDARETDVELTTAGRKVASSLREVTSRQLHRAVDGLSAAELRQLSTLLRRIGDNLSKSPIE